jgi:hypothetical protein
VEWLAESRDFPESRKIFLPDEHHGKASVSRLVDPALVSLTEYHFKPVSCPGVFRPLETPCASKRLAQSSWLCELFPANGPAGGAELDGSAVLGYWIAY